MLATSPAWADAGSPRVYGNTPLFIDESNLMVIVGTCAAPAKLPCKVEVKIGDEGKICGPVYMTVTAGDEDPVTTQILLPYECPTWDNIEKGRPFGEVK